MVLGNLYVISSGVKLVVLYDLIVKSQLPPYPSKINHTISNLSKNNDR